jgi:hypothetical protein
MKSIITTYPDFQTLPTGVKKMLLASETHYFDEAKTGTARPKPSRRTNHRINIPTLVNRSTIYFPRILVIPANGH